MQATEHSSDEHRQAGLDQPKSAYALDMARQAAQQKPSRRHRLTRPSGPLLPLLVLSMVIILAILLPALAMLRQSYRNQEYTRRLEVLSADARSGELVLTAAYEGQQINLSPEQAADVLDLFNVSTRSGLWFKPTYAADAALTLEIWDAQGQLQASLTAAPNPKVLTDDDSYNDDSAYMLYSEGSRHYYFKVDKLRLLARLLEASGLDS
ncbi:hypothetical protein HCH52_02075 [Oscillospiraceae bacterium HV4-5-C5C]|nr:hypothetical protein [Oscillospiraceae bacterium HV4-5-C5C]